MAVAGRKPKPAALRVVDGSERPTRSRAPADNASKRTPPSAPHAPQWSYLAPGKGAEQLRRDASAEWRRVVPALDRLGLLASVDRAVLVDYCLTWARVLECERTLARDGLVLEVDKIGRNGEAWVDKLRHPLSTTVSEYRRHLRAYVSELGLSPTARGRLALPGGDGADDAADLFG